MLKYLQAIDSVSSHLIKNCEEESDEASVFTKKFNCTLTHHNMETPNFIKAQTMNFRVYTFFGYWKINCKSKLVNSLYNMYSDIVILLVTVYLILQIIDLKDAWTDTEELTINLSATITSIFSISKVYRFKWKYEKVEKLREKMREFLYMPGVGVNDEDKRIFEENGTRCMSTCKMMYTLVWSTLFIWFIVPGLNYVLPVRQWFPFQLDDYGVIYYSVYFYQCIHLAFYGGVVSCMDLIFCGFVVVVCSHFDVLAKYIRSFGDSITPETVIGNKKKLKENHKKLAFIVKYHQEILHTVKELDELLQITNLIHIIGVGILISVTEYDLIQKTTQFNFQFFRQVGNLASCFVDLFIYCYYGSMLQDKSKGIAFTVYDIPWFDLTPSERNMLKLVILRSNRHSSITAGKMFPLNLASYLQVMKDSYNLLALLQQTTS